MAGGGPWLVPAAMAGLPFSRAWVNVGPPLSANGPSSGSALLMSPVPARPQLPSLSRLWPRDVMALEQSLAPLFAMIVFFAVVTADWNVSIPSVLLTPPAALLVPVRLLIVTVTYGRFSIPPWP